MGRDPKGRDGEMRTHSQGKVRVRAILLIALLVIIVVYAVQAFIYGPLPAKTVLNSMTPRMQKAWAVEFDLKARDVSIKLPFGALAGDVNLVQVIQKPSSYFVHVVSATSPESRLWEGAKLMSSGGKSFLYLAPLDGYLPLPEMPWPTFKLTQNVNEILNAAQQTGKVSIRRLAATGGIGDRKYRIQVQTEKLRALVSIPFFGVETAEMTIFDPTGQKKTMECTVDLRPQLKGTGVVFQPPEGARIVSLDLADLRALTSE